MQAVVILPDIVCIIPLHDIGRHLGPIEPPLHIDTLVNIGIHPHAQPDPAFSGAFVRQKDRRLVQDLAIILSVRTVDHKRVRIPAADDPAGVLHHFTHLLADLAQDLVSVGSSVPLVDDMEMVDIQNNGIHIYIRMILVELFRIAVEIFPVVQSGQRIPFRRLDDIPVFIKFDRTLYAGQDHVAVRIRLRNKVDRSLLQALYFRGPLGRRHDNGDPGKLFVGFYRTQHFQT